MQGQQGYVVQVVQETSIWMLTWSWVPGLLATTSTFQFNEMHVPLHCGKGWISPERSEEWGLHEFLCYKSNWGRHKCDHWTHNNTDPTDWVEKLILIQTGLLTPRVLLHNFLIESLLHKVISLKSSWSHSMQSPVLSAVPRGRFLFLTLYLSIPFALGHHCF